MKRPFYRLAIAFVRPLAWVVFRPQVRGKEHLPEGGLIICPNHLSGFDVPAVAYALAPRPVRNMGKNELFGRPLLDPLVRGLGAFPAGERTSGDGGVTTAAALAAGGETVVIFPEGARRRGRVRRPRAGAARTAVAAGVPLAPAAVRGTDGWRRCRRWQVAFGPPVALDDLRGADQARVAREATQRLWNEVRRLESELADGTGRQP